VRSPSLLTAYHDAAGGRSPLDAEGWFRTGDLGALDAAGRLTVHGRADDVIVTGGEKVNPTEVERVLEQCPGVTAACVVGLPDPTWGQLVAAALVASPIPEPALLRAAMTRGLARFQQPRRLLFVEALPRTPAGKLDRRATAELLSQSPSA
jgi:O-succinylbenzoic acid--CoA ligase